MSLDDNINASVIIPCWNVAQWLPRCLDSVFDALPERCEVIAVDDGSDDSTKAILLEYATKHSNLNVISQNNKGVSSARNRALDVCRGEYIFFVDPDDYVEKEFFESLLSRLRSQNADYCVTAFSGAKLKGDYEFRSNSEIIDGYISRIIGYSFDDVRRFNCGVSLFARREMASVWRAVFKRSIIDKYSIRFDESIVLYEDAVFNTEYLIHAHKMTCIDKPLYIVTARESGAMRTVPRNGARFCKNKLSLLSARIRLDALTGGRLWKLCEASCVFSVLEIMSCIYKRRVCFRDGCRMLAEYIGDTRVRNAIDRFPISVKRPVYAIAVLFLRGLTRIVNLKNP